MVRKWPLLWWTFRMGVYAVPHREPGEGQSLSHLPCGTLLCGHRQQQQQREMSRFPLVKSCSFRHISPSQAAQPDAQGPTRAELSAHITSLEQALLCLPATESMLATKQNIENEIRETKRQITALRPLVAQSDSCRDAVRRATSRRDAAIAQVHAAQVAVSEADAELARLQAELSS